MIHMQENKGIGAHPKPWPKDSIYDKELLEKGDSRNVIDEYRYMTVEAIKSDMQKKAIDLEIAIENYQHDFNIGTIVRNANAFNISKLHIIGSKQWNKRGAMVTDRYLEIEYYKTTADFLEKNKFKRIFSIDILKNSKPLSESDLPAGAIYVFGSESDGVSKEMIEASESVIHIEQLGSTRSVNVGVASGIFMYEWLRRSGIL